MENTTIHISLSLWIGFSHNLLSL